MFKCFQNKLILLIGGIITITQVATIGAVLIATDRSVQNRLADNLELGVRIFNELLYTSEQQLLQSVNLIAAEYAFKNAIATRDPATIESVLRNQSIRVNADSAMAVTLDGRLMAATNSKLATDQAFPFFELLERARRYGEASDLVEWEDRAYQFVLVRVKAPLQIAWLAMGFVIDREFVDHFKILTALDLSLLNRQGNLLASSVNQHKPLLNSFANLPEDTAVRRRPFTLGEINQVAIDASGTDMTSVQVTPVLHTSRNKALASYAPLKLQLIGLSALALLAAIIFATVTARGVTQPVKALIQAARKISEGNYTAAVKVVRKDEIGELTSTFNTIVHRAHYDELTGLSNRAAGADALKRAIEAYEITKQKFAVMLLDLNRFKEINDTLGHSVGDLVLKETAKRLRANLRDDDTVSRLGGDEFLVILSNTNQSNAMRVATKLSHVLQQRLSISDLNITTRASIGVALFPDHGDDAETLMRRADVSMYMAKRTQSDVELYETGLDEENLRQIVLLNELEYALESGQVVVHYQPIQALSSGRIIQLEALLRWNHPNYGMVMPAEFIPLAEESGRVRKITNWVLQNVIRQCREWADLEISVNVSVNLSALDLMDSGLPDIVMRYLNKYNVKPECLTLEVTESAIMRDTAIASVVIRQLRQLGISIAIDDFGTGLSSLGQLRHLTVNVLKLDKSFIMKLKEDSDDLIIVRSIIDLGHSMGLQVTAEGVETPRALAILKDHACDFAQGYFIGYPLPVEQITDALVLQNASMTDIQATTNANRARSAQRG